LPIKFCRINEIGALKRLIGQKEKEVWENGSFGFIEAVHKDMHVRNPYLSMIMF